MKIDSEQNKSFFSGVVLGYLILVLHILLMIVLGFTVVLIKGIYDFRWLIFVAGVALIAGSAFYFYRYFQDQSTVSVTLWLILHLTTEHLKSA